MGYTPLAVSFRKNRLSIPSQNSALTQMAKSGKNLRDLPQFLSPDFALENTNYFITTDGGLSKRKGLEKIFEVAGIYPITLLEKFTSDIYIFAYNNIVAAYTKSTSIITNIKTNFSTSDPFTGARWGDYFFICNGSEAIGRIDLALTYTTIAGAPICKVIRVGNSRLYAGNLSTDATAVAYSTIDTGSNPPFTSFTVGTLATDGGLLNNRNAGPVNDINFLGDIVVVFAVDGKWAFRTVVQTTGTQIVKNDDPVIWRQDFGGASGSLLCAKGLFYVNSAGLWQIVSFGQPNIPFSDQEGLNSILLGTGYFDNINLSNADMTYYARYSTVLLTCAKASQRNNFIIAFNAENKSFSEFTGWTINRFLNDEQEIYGASSYGTKVWHLFQGNSDDGKDIYTNYYQELKTGDLETRQILLGGYVQGLLSLLTNLRVAFDIFNVEGNEEKDKLIFTWTSQNANNLTDGYGIVSWGQGVFAGQPNAQGLLECFDGFRDYIRNYQRIRIHITGHDQLPHQINWVKLNFEVKVPIRRRKMKKVS